MFIYSFYLTFIVLAVVTILNIYKAYSSTSKAVRTDLAINLVALTAYFIMIKFFLANPDMIRNIRYIDWVITTPLLLLAFIQWSNGGKSIPATPLALLLVYNILMIIAGYIGGGEKVNGFYIIGLIFFILTFYTLWKHFVKTLPEEERKKAKKLYIAFAVVWALYGVAYLFGFKNRSIFYNILDLVSKAGFGIFLISVS